MKESTIKLLSMDQAYYLSRESLGFPICNKQKEA